MTLKQTRWEEITRQLDGYDYPSEQIAQHGGIPTDTMYCYVSTAFLNGLINYIDNCRAFLMNRYCNFHREPLDGPSARQLYEAKARELGGSFHPRFATTENDDVQVVGETETDFWVFWFDCDCSDSCVTRLSKATFPDLTRDLLVEIYLEHLHETYSCWKHAPHPEPIIVEILSTEGKPPGGWWRG